MNHKLTAILKNRAKPADTGGRVRARTDRASASDWRSRCATALPWALLAGFLVLLVLLVGDRFLPVRALSIATVVTVRESIDPNTTIVSSIAFQTSPAPISARTPMLFQASGWIEPAPYPILATALVGGVIDTVDVLEGEQVEQGQLLATLIDEDARLDLETAESRLDSLEAQADAHDKQINVAEAELNSLGKLVAAAIARRNESADLAARLERAGSIAVPEQEVARARLEHLTREAEAEALAATRAEFQAKLEQLQETISDFAARIDAARTEVARRQLALDRTRIHAPIEGRVLRLLAVPGQKKLFANDNPESAVVAILYDPTQLQARIDVPLSEAAQLFPGQAVRVRSEFLPDTVFSGHVSRIVGEADLQRNTLQVKVAIENPDGRLRPEMLCRAEFLALARTPPASKDRPGPARSSIQQSGPGRVRIFAPAAALGPITGSANPVRSTVWKVDPTGDRVIRQPVTLGTEQKEAHRLVLDGLKPGDRVVLSPPSDLEDGDRFRNEASEASSKS